MNIYSIARHAEDLGFDVVEDRYAEDLWSDARINELLSDGMTRDEAEEIVDRERRDRPWVKRTRLWDEP